MEQSFKCTCGNDKFISFLTYNKCPECKSRYMYDIHTKTLYVQKPPKTEWIKTEYDVKPALPVDAPEEDLDKPLIPIPDEIPESVETKLT